ncbi:MAG TPA: GntR family transcriptional regulator [Usitatibacteraceae bacterium]|nr:GntR family transcriptional regulator [Usitatibacteraceae bacterium]
MSARAAAPLVASQPQYVLVAQSLMDDIAGGRYPVGSLLPAEFDLCTQFGVSRHTVREALRRLQERGLVTRQRGIGTCVKAARAEGRYVQSTSAIADLPRYVEDTRLVTTATQDVIADEALAERLPCPAGQRWVKVSCLRYAGKSKLPMALTEIYIHAAYGGIRKLVGAMKVPVHQLLESKYGVAIVEVAQEIRATAIGAADARRLGVKAGSAGLLVTRRYFGDNDRLVEVAVNLHPADRFSHSMSMRLQGPAGANA